MAESLSYDSLVTLILAETNRSDAAFIAIMPQLIMLAQRRIDNNIKTLGQDMYVFGNFLPPQTDSSQGVLAKPVRWRNTLSFAYGSGTNNQVWTPLKLRSYDFCRNYWPNQMLLAPPKYYCDFGFNNILVVPTPDLAYPTQFAYMQAFPPIDEVNQTNWLTDNAPETVFYATLLEAMVYLQNDQRVPLIEAQFKQAVTALGSTDADRLTDRFAQRDKD